MTVFFVVAIFIFGLLVGSFLNVVALRFNTGKGIGGRSFCFSCGHCLRWYELIPVFSWMIQRGRCRSCSSALSQQYFFGELMTGIVFAVMAARGLFVGSFTLSLEYLLGTVFLLVISSVLIVIIHYDLRHKIIPDQLSIVFATLSLIGLFFFGFDSEVFVYLGFHLPTWIQLCAGILVPLPFVLMWLVSGGKWIGLGDPKLMVGIGFLLGLSQGFSSVIVAFWIGTLFVIVMYLLRFIFKKSLLQASKNSIMKTEVPFAPFLIVALWLTIILNLNFFLW